MSVTCFGGCSCLLLLPLVLRLACSRARVLLLLGLLVFQYFHRFPAASRTKFTLPPLFCLVTPV